MPKFKIVRDETYVYHVEADSIEQAQEIADTSENDKGELINIHNEVWKEIKIINRDSGF